ncbi:MAG: ExeM/NucH family extracellular endonuclease [Litoreibacter sp.]
MRRTIFSEDFNDFDGSGFNSEPGAGQLDLDVWAVSGFSSDADESRGISDGPEQTGGVYAVDRGDEDRGLLIQPGGSDFTPGFLTLNLNTGETDLTDVTVAFDRLVRNDQGRGSAFNLEYSVDGVTFLPLDAFTSDADPDDEGLTSTRVTVNLPDLPANTDLILRWEGADVDGSGSRDEFGIDNVLVDGVEGAAPAAPVVINKVLASTTGADSEFIELFGTAGASLAGLSFIGVESDPGDANGTIDFRFDFADDAVIGANGFILLANQLAQETYGVTANITITGSLENSSTTFALVSTSSIFGDAITGDEVVIDSVGVDDGDYTNPGIAAPIVGPDGSFLPAGIARVEDGVDTDTAEDFGLLSFNNDPAVNQPTAGTDEPPQATVINKVLVSTTGADSEFIEIFGEAGASLAGLSFIGVESDPGDANGTIDFRFDFADDAVIGDNGFLLLANQVAQSTYSVAANITISDSLENSSSTFALVQTDSIVGNAITGSEVVVDSVGVDDGDYSNPGIAAPIVGPDGSFFPAGVARLEDGVDTDTAEDFGLLNFNNDPAVNQPTTGTGLDGGGTVGDVTIDSEATLIHTIQGSGAESALVGQTVVIEAIVTGDFQDGDADDSRNLSGFYVMEEDADHDGDASTSEGLFIDEFGLGTLTDVNQGDKVRVLGVVSENFGKTRIIVQEIVIVEEDSSATVTAASVDLSVTAANDLEAFESMLVNFEEPLTFSESFDYEAFGALTLTAGGPVFQYSQLNAPDVAGNTAYQEEVASRSILLEDGISGSRSDFDPITEPDGDVIAGPTDGIRMGQSVSNLTAIVDFDFGDYRLRLPQESFFELDEETNPVEEAPEDVGSAYKVASLNVLNYFTTIDGLTDNGNDPRGADDFEELGRQTDKLVATLLGMDADVIGLIEIENDFSGDNFALKTLVQALNDTEGGDRWAFVDPGQEFVGDDAIAVAFIYDQTTTDLVGGASILDTEEFLDPLGELTTNGDAFNRAALAQSFQEKESGGIFTASVNHFKSKGSATGAAADDDAGDGAGRGNATRTEAARILSEWLASDPTNSGDDDVLILGDLNSYAKEAPITTLEDAGFTDLGREFEGDEVYSFRFSGQIGTLDYALANEELLEQVTGATTWNINSDTPVFFDYNTDNTFGFPNTLRPTDQGLFDGDSPLRASDHDPIILGLDLDDDRIVEPILITGTTSNERLIGTDADEIIIAGGGTDLVFGGGGSDTFVFTDVDGGRDSLRISDFDVATDALDIGSAEIASTRQLGDNLLVSLSEDRDTIVLLGVNDIDEVNIFTDVFDLT